jgi:hypothetical protein
MSEIVLRCDDCGLPWARVRNGVLMVESRHHGEKHTGVIPVAELVKMCQEGTPDGDHSNRADQSARLAGLRYV